MFRIIDLSREATPGPFVIVSLLMRVAKSFSFIFNLFFHLDILLLSVLHLSLVFPRVLCFRSFLTGYLMFPLDCSFSFSFVIFKEFIHKVWKNVSKVRKNFQGLNKI